MALASILLPLSAPAIITCICSHTDRLETLLTFHQTPAGAGVFRCLLHYRISGFIKTQNMVYKILAGKMCGCAGRVGAEMAAAILGIGYPKAQFVRQLGAAAGRNQICGSSARNRFSFSDPMFIPWLFEEQKWLPLLQICKINQGAAGFNFF